MARLHAMIGEHLGDDADEAEVVVGIETERGPWVRALIAAGYQVYAVNPLQVARFRERQGVSGAKSDTGDAHALADMVRTDRHQLRPVAGDSPQADAVKVLTRAHKTLIWERTRHLLRLRHTLREFFPAALVAFDDLTAADALQLLADAPDPTSAAALSIEQIESALKLARRRNRAAKAQAIAAALRAEHLGQPPIVTAAYAATIRAQVAILTVLNTQVKSIEEQVDAHFSKHPDAKVYLSQPGLGIVLGARVLGEFGDDKNRYADAKARKNYAGTSPITGQSGKKKVVLARYVRNDRLRRRARATSLRRAQRLTRRPRVLRPTPRPRRWPPRRTTTARQPPRRHPPRLPQDRNNLRRRNSVAHNPPRSTTRRLTTQTHGMSRPDGPSPTGVDQGDLARSAG
jgi:transposase